jgi:DNA repair exonuclease SbcCD ATPase subunit
MKKYLLIIIVLLVAVLMVLTVPDKAKHKEAMMEAINEYVEEEAVDKLGDNVLARLGKGVIVKTVETALNSKLKIENYYLFNKTYVRLDGEDQMLSLGMFGHVFTFDKEMLREKLEEAMNAKEEAKSEKEAAKQSAKELKRLQKEQRKREKELAKEAKRKAKEAKKEAKRKAKEAKRKAKEAEKEARRRAKEAAKAAKG